MVMDKKYTTSEFNLSEEIIIEDGKRKGMRYTLEVRAASSELKNLYLLNLFKQEACNCGNIGKNRSNLFSRIWRRLFK